MSLRMRNTIAGAVARATLRIEADPGYLVAESAAYKAVLIERGSPVDVICQEPGRDFTVMAVTMRYWRHGERMPSC